MRILFLILFSVLQLFVTMPIQGLAANIKTNHHLAFKKASAPSYNYLVSSTIDEDNDSEDDEDYGHNNNCYIWNHYNKSSTKKYYTLFAIHSAPNYSVVQNYRFCKIPIYLFVENFRI